MLNVNGVKVFVDPFSAQYLEGVEIDYVTSMMGQGFTFQNPQASGGCGCGSSFTVNAPPGLTNRLGALT